MKHILAPITIDELPLGWAKDFPFHALSVKPMKAAAAVKLLPPGVELHLWEWCSFRNQIEARAWGTKMGLECAKYGAKRFYMDAEGEWAGSEGFPITANPYTNLLEAVTAFFLSAPTGTELAYNGYDWSRTSDGRKLLDKDLVKLFHAWVPQIYSALSDKRFGFAAKLARYDIPNQLRVPMLYAGRYDKTSGAFIGNSWKEQKALIEKHKPPEVAWYFGNGSKSRYAELCAMVREPLLDNKVDEKANLHTVIPGDSWWALADHLYGDGKLWPRLKTANGNPKELHPGDKIKVPKKEDLPDAGA